MYARLWWKDARQFWPIWVVLLLGAAGTQWMVLASLGLEARYGGLGISALIWASLYAVAAGAAAFAGERETGTLRLLDIMPADRRVVWAGKVSFALVTSAALTLVLLVMAAWSTESWNPRDPLTASQAICFVMFVLVALGWGLFWSSILKSALTSAVAAIGCAALTLMFLTATYWDVRNRQRSDPTAPIGIAEIVVIGVSVAASGAFFTAGARSRRLNLKFRSPIVVTRSQSSSRSPVTFQAPVLSVPTISPRPIAVANLPEASGALPSIRSSWMVEARTLARQTIKEGINRWFLLAAIALVPPLLASLFQSNLDVTPLALAGVLVALVAGASALGLENRASTRRFLVHHGASPGLVWLVKLSVWVAGVAVIGVLAAGAAATQAIVGLPRMERILAAYLLTLSVTFGVATLCGMASRRGITALVLGLVLAWALLMPLFIMNSMNLLPTAGMALVSIALLVVSWAWRRDWIMDRPAPGRWLRLGIFLGGAFAVLFAGYVGFRVWSVPDVGPIAKPAAWIGATLALPSSDPNAADLYREASSRLIGPATAPDFLSRNNASLDLIRRAAAERDCWFAQPDEQTLFDNADMPPEGPLATLVSLEAKQRMGQGDLAGSWDDIMVLFHMARHFSEGSGGGPATRVLTSVERDALGLAMKWVIARGQSTERLHAALGAYREMPKMPSAADIVRGEANIVENTFDLPANKFRDGVQALLDRGGLPAERPWAQTAFSYWTLTPWERNRGRRVNRMISADAIRQASIEPAQRPELVISGSADSDLRSAWDTTPPLTKGLFWNWVPPVRADDLNEVGRRALVQILAIRAWQLKHDGQFPERLEALVPEELATLPNDPYSGHPFGFIRNEGRRTLPLRSALGEPNGFALERALVDSPPGSRLLYSIGPDREDNGGLVVGQDRTAGPLDIIYAIPPVEQIAEPAKDKAGAAKDRPTAASPK